MTIPPHHRLATWVSAALLVGVPGCLDTPGGPERAAGNVAIDIAPLDLPGVDDATYTLTVENESGDVVWSRQITSSSYGDGAGSLSYVGPCDADDDPNDDGDAVNTVKLVVDALSADGAALTAGIDYVNPAPAGSAIGRDAICAADRDTPVSFDLTIARRAQQGFFDVAVSFDDVFCSAKLDCVYPDGDDADTDPDPILLLHDDDGARGRTIVFGFACTGGDDTHLYLDDLEIDCGASGTTTLSPAGPAGLKGAVAPLVFQYAVYRGDEQLTTGGADAHKRYWNVAVGVDEAALPTADVCTLTARGTASESAFEGFAPPPGSTWPVLAWDVPLNTPPTQALSCGRYAVDGGDEVATSYAAGLPFAWSYPEEGLELLVDNANATALASFEVHVTSAPLTALTTTCPTGFTLSSAGAPVPYCWDQPNGECGTAPSATGLWMRVPTLAAGATTTVTAACTGVASASPGGDVFRYYDDLNGAALDLTNRWLNSAHSGSLVYSVANGYLRLRFSTNGCCGHLNLRHVVGRAERTVYENRIMAEGTSGNWIDVLRMWPDSGSEYIVANISNTLTAHWCDRCGNPSGGCSVASTGYGISAGAWNTYAMVKYSDYGIRAYANGTQVWSRDYPCTTGGFGLGITSRTSDYDMRVDWARVRNWAPIAPTVTVAP